MPMRERRRKRGAHWKKLHNTEPIGDRDDVLADWKVAKHLLVDVFGKEQGPLLVA